MNGWTAEVDTAFVVGVQPVRCRESMRSQVSRGNCRGKRIKFVRRIRPIFELADINETLSICQ